METNKIYQGDSLEVLKTLPDESIDCCVSSPPYWGLRDYGIGGQIGLEKTPEEYVNNIVNIYREIKRILKKEGTCWLNLGDSYVGGGFGVSKDENYDLGKQGTNRGTANFDTRKKLGSLKKKIEGLKHKDLVGIPWRVAFALQADGWWLRQDIIWAKNNPMPESVTDRCTKSHEYVFLLTKSPKYYFDNEAIKEPTVTRDKTNRDRDSTRLNNTPGRTKMAGLKTNDYETRNKRDVWNINTKPFKEAHFAVFPEALVEPMIKAGCPEFICNKCGKTMEKKYKRVDTEIQRPRKFGHTGNNDRNDTGDIYKEKISKFIGYEKCECNVGFSGGVVLDPFFGSGTTGVVAKKLGRNYIGIELNSEYIKIAEKRVSEVSNQLSLIK